MAMITEQPTLLQQANQAFRERNYAIALDKYQKIVKAQPELSKLIQLNLKLAAARLNESTASTVDAVKSAPKIKFSPQKIEVNGANSVIVSASNLIPLANLEATKEKGVWLATTDDPHFHIYGTISPKIKPGLYHLEIELTFDKSFEIPTIYLDEGAGYSELNALKLPLRKNKKESRLLYLTKPILNLRFDPIAHQGRFCLKTFTLKTVEQVKAIAEIKAKLKQEKIAFDQDNNDISYLYKQYNKLYTTDIGSASYTDWIELIEKPTLPTRAEAVQKIKQMKIKPVFSVVMPTYNTDERYLRECIDSVLSQSYSNLEFCIADDNSPKEHVIKVLDQYAQKDARVKVVKRKQNGHISKATNSAIDLVTGDFIVLLDHDDAIPEHALYFMAEAINQNPNAKILYSDEDKIDEEGNRSNPHFKSDWNPDLFFSQNYVSHLGVYKTDIIKKIGGFRTGVEGSQDQDLLLRCLPYVKHHEIEHIPKVLYHWRMIEGSTALASGEKSYTTNAGIKALSDYFKQNGPQGITVEAGLLPNTYKVNWPIPKPHPLVSLLIPTRDKMLMTQVAVESILKKTTYQHYEIIILDNGSVEQKTLNWFAAIQKKDNRVKVLRYDHPFNYSAINNFGVKHAKGTIVGLINNDIEVISPEWLTEMLSHALRPDIGCVGAKLYYPDEKIQHAGVILGIGGVANHSHKMFERNHPGYFGRLVCIQNLSAVTAAVLLIRKEIYNQVNGLNEKDLQVAFNDVDFCLKVREAGYRNVWTPYAELYHYESISRGDEDTPEKKQRFAKEVNYMMQTWGNALDQDPYYSPNLTKVRENFSITS